MGFGYPICAIKFYLNWLWFNGDLLMNKQFHLKYAMIVSHLIADDKAKWSKIYFFHINQYLKGSK
jgi:hypothetical protein